MGKDCMNVCVMNCLRLNADNLKIANACKEKNHNNTVTVGMHIRIENDWQKYSVNKTKKMDENEIILVDLNKLINMYKQKWPSNNKVFFTTGENQTDVKQKLYDNHLWSDYFFDSALEYEINAAINFVLCCSTDKFVGLSRSTFSNLITLKRHLLGIDNSFIYNNNNEIIERVDCGLHSVAHDAVTHHVSIV